MLLAERDNVPTVVSRTVFLDMCTYFRLLSTCLFRAVCGERLATELFPVVEPATAFTGTVACAIDVLHFHGSLLCICSAPTKSSLVALERSGRAIQCSAWLAGFYFHPRNCFTRDMTSQSMQGPFEHFWVSFPSRYFMRSSHAAII